jgi:exosortase A
MNAPATTAAPASVLDWRRVAAPIGVGLLVLGAVFNGEIEAALRTWTDSTAYNHCFLVIPIAAYLLWDRRFDLRGVAARPWKPAFLLGVPVALVWLLAERLGVMEGRQLAAMSFVELLFLAVLGRRLWWAMAGPLLYLYFLVPFGEFLTPQLQDVTTWFIRHGLETLGVPAYVDGYVIEIPQGAFFVAEACAGLRFLIASIAFGCLYALMIYRSPVRRTIFIVVSVIMPIIANGFRGIGIVYLGYLLNSAQAAAADHLIYGWVFFSFVILLLILLGLPFRQDHLSTRSASEESADASGPPPGWRSAAAAAAALVAVACISPSLAGGLALVSAAGGSAPEAIDLGQGCTITALPADSLRERSQRVTCGQTVFIMRWKVLSPRSTAAAVMAARRQMGQAVESESLAQAWLETADGSASAWRIMRSGDPEAMLAMAVWVDGRPVRPGMRMRVRMALDSLLGPVQAPLVMTVTPVVDWPRLNLTERRVAEAGLGDFLVAHPELDRVVGALTAD